MKMDWDIETEVGAASGAAIQSAQRIPKALALAIDSARYVSNRGGVAWVVTQNGKVVASRSSFYGYPQTELFDELNAWPGSKNIYLSTEPHSAFVDSKALLSAAKRNHVESIHFPSCKGIRPVGGMEKSRYGSISIHRHDVAGASDVIHYGPYTLTEKKRPWVTAITATDMIGGSVPLTQFYKEFGARSYIERTIGQSHALINQIGYEWCFVDITNNALGVDLIRYDVHSSEDVTNALSQQYLMQNATVALVADTCLIGELVNEGVVDEIIYHIDVGLAAANKMGAISCQHRPNLNGWEITSSTHFAHSCRIKVRNTPF